MERPIEEQQMRAKEDARILAQAQAIQGDPGRHQAAMKMADAVGREAIEQAKSMNEVAKGFYPRQVEHQKREQAARGGGDGA